MSSSWAFLAWISCVHLLCSGTCILISSKSDLVSANATQKLPNRKNPSDLSSSSSFNVLRGLYPPVGVSPAPHPHPHPENDYPFSHPHPQTQTHPHPPAPSQPVTPCTLSSHPIYLILPISSQYLNQPRVKHTIKTVITDEKEVTTSLNDQPYARNLNLSLSGISKSANKEQEVHVVLPTPQEGFITDDGLDLPIFRDLTGIEPIELEDNLIPGGQGLTPEKAFLFRPYGVFKPATAATLSAPQRGASVQTPLTFQRNLNFPPLNLAYLRPRPSVSKEDPEQWRPSVEQPFVIHSRPASVSVQKSSSTPCAEPETEAKEAKVDSKIDSIL